MNTERTFTLIPALPGRGADTLARLLAREGLAEARDDGPRAWTETYLDTATGRLFTRGWRLRHRDADDRWILEGETGRLAEQPGMLAAGLGPGPVRERVSDVDKGHGLVRHLAVKIVERRFRPRVESRRAPDEPSAPPPEPAVLFELVFVDPHDARERPGPHLLGAAGEETGDERHQRLLRDLPGASVVSIDLLVAGLGALGLPRPGAPAPRALRLTPEDTIAEAALKILRRQALAMRAYRRGCILDLDIEYVHQLRVASRRTRAALSLFSPWLEAPRARRVSKEVGRIGRTLGRVRDMDVLTPVIEADLERAGAAPEIAARVREAFRRRRTAALEGAIRFLASPEFTEILAALEALAPATDAEPEEASAVAPRLIEKAARRFRKWRRRKFKELTEDDLHRIRIAFKRLRYVGEFFTELESGPFREAVKQLVPYQDCLGDAQDARVAREYLRQVAEVRCADGRPDVDELFALGELDRLQREKMHEQRAAFRELWRKFPKRTRRLQKALHDRRR